MTDLKWAFADPDFVHRYLAEGPPAFTPGHAGMLQMAWQLLAESVPPEGDLLVVGAGGGLDTRAFAERSRGWRFVGVDPSAEMLALARHTAGEAAGERLELLQGSAEDAPPGPFDGATLICVLGIVPDGGPKLDLLAAIHRRLKPGSPFILVDQCFERDAPDHERRLGRWLAYARGSGVPEATLRQAETMMRANAGMVDARRDEALLGEAGFSGIEVFYRAMAWIGWVAYA